MNKIIITRDIDAPIANVFDTVAHIEEFAKAIPHVVKVELLSDKQKGLGTRFRETRLLKGKELSSEFEVKEYVENEHVRLLTDSHGIVWDTKFSVEVIGRITLLKMAMQITAYKFFPKIKTLLFKGGLTKAIGKDMDSIKAYCEKRHN